MNSISSPIPWYRIHVVTCVAMMIVGAALLWIQTMPGFAEWWVSVLLFGWPLSYSSNSGVNLLPYVSWPAAVFNLAVAVTLIAGVGTVFELLIRGAASRLQVSLTSMLVVIFAVAVMLGERYADWNMYAIAEWLNLRPTLLAEYPWYCSVPIYFAIFCTLCTFAWLAMAMISNYFRRFNG